MPKTSPVTRIPSYAAFWQHYLTQHQNPVNRALHCVGTCGSAICLGLAAFLSWKWLLAALVCGYGIAWLGHLLIERNRPLTFTYPLWSLRADYHLVALILMGWVWPRTVNGDLDVTTRLR